MFASFRRPSRPASDEPFVPPSADQVRRLFAYLRPYRGRMAIAVLALIFGAALGLVFPWIMQNLVDAVLGQRDRAELNRITFILLGTFLIRSVFYYFQGYYLAYVGERIVVDLRRQAYEHLHRLSVRFFTDRRVGELISRLSSDVTLVRAALTNNVATVLSQALTFVGSLVLMLALNWRLTLFILALAPLIALSGAIFGARLRKLSTTVQDQLADGTALAEEALSGVRVVKAFTREPYEVQRYGDQMERTFNVTMRLTIIRSAFGPLITFLGFGALAGILWFGGREVIAGRLTGGALIAFLVYGINIVASLGAFTSLYTQIQEALGASRRIFELLDEQPEIRDAPNARALPPVKGRLTFDHVSFSYPGVTAQATSITSAGSVRGLSGTERSGVKHVLSEAEGSKDAPLLREPPSTSLRSAQDARSAERAEQLHPQTDRVLRDIALEIQPGEVLALVGPSGAGKSTLFSLIPRFYDPTGGRVCVDGHDLREVTLESLRGQIGLVPQETQLFSGTVRENLRYGKLDANDTELEGAARAANAEEFILRLPQKYDTLVGEKGVKLSGGQRQRIAIARAILKDPRLLLLDEATSSLDSESEGLVQEALDRLMRSRTTVIIAHRLSTVHRADRIAVLDQGRLIELGNHTELMALDGLYARLYRMQFRNEGVAALA
ncbi:MAG: ABC transporter related [Anaerolineales bacterium]|nr:ABC transporter related [Anaerolineales bacterium]